MPLFIMLYIERDFDGKSEQIVPRFMQLLSISFHCAGSSLLFSLHLLKSDRLMSFNEQIHLCTWHLT